MEGGCARFADLWLPSIVWREPIPPGQLKVLAGVIADTRIQVPKKLYDGAGQKAAPELRAALGSRIVNQSSSSETRNQLAVLLSYMPDGAFASLRDDERAFLGSVTLRRDCYPLIVRLVDRGEAAVPDLLNILRTDSKSPEWYQRDRVMRALSLAFAILGTEARSALPEVDALVNQEQSPVMNIDNDRMRWYLALARMGKPIGEFQWIPRDNPEAIASGRQELRGRLDRFDAKRVWEY